MKYNTKWRDRLAYCLFICGVVFLAGYSNGLFATKTTTNRRASYSTSIGASTTDTTAGLPSGKSSASWRTCDKASAACRVWLSTSGLMYRCRPIMAHRAVATSKSQCASLRSCRRNSSAASLRSRSIGFSPTPPNALLDSANARIGLRSNVCSRHVTTRTRCPLNGLSRWSLPIMAVSSNFWRGPRLLSSRSNLFVASVKRLWASSPCRLNCSIVLRCLSSNAPSCSPRSMAVAERTLASDACLCTKATLELANSLTRPSARAPKNSNIPSPMMLLTASQNPSVRSPLCQLLLLSSSNTLPSEVIRYLMGKIRSARSSRRIPTKSATVATRSQTNHTSALCSNHTLMISSINAGENGEIVNPLMVDRQRREKIENVVIIGLIVAVVAAAMDSIYRAFRR